jgi:DNA-binding transcriptional ArsR family regulator
MRSYRTCWLPADHPELATPPRDTGAYVPELAARVDDDTNLTDGARRCARKLAEYVHRRDRDSHTAEITVTWLMKALAKSRRTVQRYLRQLERAGYITVHVIHARTRMCAGLMVALLAPVLPRHGWKKSIKPDAPKLSHKNSFRYRTRLIPRVLWAIKCTDPIREAWDRMLPPLPPFF